MKVPDMTKHIAIGAFAGIMVGFVIANFVGTIKAVAVVEAYERGRKSALSINPVSVELEMTCANIWSNQVQPPEVFRK